MSEKDMLIGLRILYKDWSFSKPIHISDKEQIETTLKQAIEKLPSAQQWIPCSERLPERPKNYPNCEIRRCYYLVSLESGCVKTLGYEFDRNEWQITGSPVIAWRPLPEPFKES